MGLDVNGTRFLLYALKKGTDISRTAMIGRQGLHVSYTELFNNLAMFGYECTEDKVKSLFDEKGYSEKFLAFLGAEEIDSYDNSDYEGATTIHDMNDPIPEKHKDHYSLVIDGGSLEHVFNFPIAIRNCMEMLNVGGHYLCILPVNNMMGHGLYQFSPELFFRIFSEENGFRMEKLIIYESEKNAKWYEVIDPAKLGKRVELRNLKQTYIMVLAKKLSTCIIFQNNPQQSDYIDIWESSKQNQGIESKSRSIKKRLIRNFLREWRRLPFHTPGPRDHKDCYKLFNPVQDI